MQRQSDEAKLNEEASAAVMTNLEDHSDEDANYIEVIDKPLVVPFLNDKSHRIIEGGGFVACLRCGAMASTATARNAALPMACLGPAACRTASKSRLKRFQGGDHPRPDRPLWPDGSPEGKLSRQPRLRPGVRPSQELGITELHLHV